MIEVIKAYPLATVFSVKDNEPLVTHMPLIYRESDGKLIGHIDIYNPQTKLMRDDNDLTIIFSGPQCYISPSVYTTTQLPTWNYIKVHLKGTVKAIESKEALKESLIIMTEFLEQPDHKYVLEANNPRMDGNLDYIKMFEIYNNNNERMRDWFGALFEIPDFKNISNARAYIRLKVNDLPDEAIFKMAAQMQSMLKSAAYSHHI